MKTMIAAAFAVTLAACGREAPPAAAPLYDVTPAGALECPTAEHLTRHVPGDELIGCAWACTTFEGAPARVDVRATLDAAGRVDGIAVDTTACTAK